MGERMVRPILIGAILLILACVVKIIEIKLDTAKERALSCERMGQSAVSRIKYYKAEFINECVKSPKANVIGCEEEFENNKLPEIRVNSLSRLMAVGCDISNSVDRVDFSYEN